MQDAAKDQWHTEILPETARSALQRLREAGILDDFYLAGGTGLALQFGHRRSIDLDFFTTQFFDVDVLIQRLQNLSGFAVSSMGISTLHGEVSGVKASFLSYEYSLLFPLLEFAQIAVADWRDIACMKISAIAGRGTRRDFIDLHAAAQRRPLAGLVEQFRRKYSRVNYSSVHIFKSLTYFQDAEKEEMPEMLLAVRWDEVTAFFRREVPRLNVP